MFDTFNESLINRKMLWGLVNRIYYDKHVINTDTQYHERHNRVKS